ncbi:MAG: hypothetical protein FWE76_06435, partial [Symbiobacteriaceae bacterium]|nr:hypothetical protein [Symbiobacteriaceae bacterium]
GSYVFGFAAYHYGSGYTHGPSGSFFLPDARLLTVGSTLSGFLEESSQNCLLLVDLFNPAQSVILTPDTLISGFSWHDPLAVFLEADSGRLGIVLLTQDEPTPERILSDAAVTRYRVNEGKLLYLTGDNALYALDFLNENESICLISAGAYSDAGIDDFLYWMGNVYFTLSNGELWAVKLDDANNLPHLVAGEVQSMTVGNDGVYFLRGGLNPGLSRVANGVVEELYTGLTQALGNNNLGEVVFLPARSDGSFMIFR